MNRQDGGCCNVCGSHEGPFFIISHQKKIIEKNPNNVSLVTKKICKSCQVFSLKSLLMAAHLIRES